MGICLGSYSRGLGTYYVPSPLAFCQEELLVWCQTVYRWLRAFAFAGFFVSPVGEVDPAKIAQRYRNRADYVAKVQEAVDALKNDRLLLQEDADKFLEKARNESRVNP